MEIINAIINTIFISFLIYAKLIMVKSRFLTMVDIRYHYVAQIIISLGLIISITDLYRPIEEHINSYELIYKLCLTSICILVISMSYKIIKKYHD